MEPLPTNEFLKKLGFSGGNPFSETQAEEEDNLSKYFVDLPAYYKILDMDTGKPKSSILGADRGCGKSANRKNVERWLLQGPPDKSIKGKWAWKSPVLAIPYTDFSRLRASVNDDFAKLHPGHHVDSIIWSGIKSLIKIIENSWEKFRNVELSQWDWARLGYFLSRYSERWGNPTSSPTELIHLSTTVDFFQTALSHAPHAEKISQAGYSGLLQNFTELALSLGFTNVVVLVDGVDEIDITADDPELSALLLKPLISERALMQIEGLRFKFFLPNQVIENLKEIPETRLGERIKFYHIEWSDEAIQELLSLRLSAFSGNRFNDLAQIASPDLRDISNRLALHVENNPRNLLRLAEQVLIKLEENTKASGTSDKNRPPRITKTILEDALMFYDKHVAPDNSYIPDRKEKVKLASASKWKITPDLHVEYKGKIINEDKLDPKEFEILKYFLEHPDERVSRNEIGKAVWKEKWVDKYDWVLNQAILRLRKKIGRQRIKTVRGVGYIFHTGE